MTADIVWVIGMDGATLAKAKAYEAKHSLPGYPDPSPELRERVLAATEGLPQYTACEDVKPVNPNAEWPDPDWYATDVACATCEDNNPNGIRVGEWSVWMPCPDCPGADDDGYSWQQELYDDMERGK